MGRRIRWLGLIFIIVFALVLAQLVNVQLVKAPGLGSAAANPRNASAHLDNLRGPILLENGTVLAQSVRATKSPFKYQRIYSQGSLYSGVVGYSSLFYGTSGLEYEYNSYLTQHKQPAQNLQQLLSPPQPTTDSLVLTLDPTMQKAAQQALNSIVGPNKDGAIVAIDPTTGDIEAMYSSPTFDPNPLASANVSAEQLAMLSYNVPDHEGFRPIEPMATQLRFPPGSTSKVVTTAAVYDRDPSLSTYSASYESCTNLPQGRQLCNDDDERCGGPISQMLPQSCDTGYAMLGLALGGTKLSQEAQSFGYNQVPPLDLPHVIPSAFPRASQFGTGPNDLGAPGVAYSSIGQQNVAATALQNALIAAGIADGGVIMTPHLVHEIDGPNGQIVKSFTPVPWLRPASQSTAAAITPLMQAVASSGTAAGTLNLGLDPAVKTGTAQTGNGTNDTDDWMIGFAPANDPKIAVAVVVPSQAVSATGAAVAGPIMNAMLTAARSASDSAG